LPLGMRLENGEWWSVPARADAPAGAAERALPAPPAH